MRGVIYAVSTALAWALVFAGMGYLWFGRTPAEVVYGFTGAFTYGLMGMWVGRWWSR